MVNKQVDLRWFSQQIWIGLNWWIRESRVRDLHFNDVDTTCANTVFFEAWVDQHPRQPILNILEPSWHLLDSFEVSKSRSLAVSTKTSEALEELRYLLFFIMLYPLISPKNSSSRRWVTSASTVMLPEVGFGVPSLASFLPIPAGPGLVAIQSQADLAGSQRFCLARTTPQGVPGRNQSGKRHRCFGKFMLGGFAWRSSIEA